MPSRVRRGSAAGSDRSRASRPRSASTASRCATSPSPSSWRRSAAGSPPAPPGTSRRSGRTSRTSWSPRARSRPSGVWESRRLPGSGAGPSPDRLLAGSEGILGVITSAWVRVQPRPEHRASAGVRFPDFARGAECVRAISQSGLHPSNCRLLDAGEAELTMAGDGSHALLVLGFESTDHPVDGALERALDDLRGARRRGAAAAGGRRRRGRLVAQRVPRRAVRARSARRARRHQRDVRDRDHLGALPALARARDGHRARGAARGLRRGRARLLPLHPRLPRRSGAVLHDPRARAPRRGGRAVAGDQAAPSRTC